MRFRLFYFLLFFTLYLFSQETKDKIDTVDTTNGLLIEKVKNQTAFEINALAPAKAAFYSAILPGLGQAYNKKYWLIPVIYGGMTASMYYYTINDKRYNEFMDAYKLDLAGKPHDFENLDQTALERGINQFKKNRDLSLFITIGIYILNILEANVDAHIPIKKIDTNLSYRPSFTIDPITNSISYGASVQFGF